MQQPSSDSQPFSPTQRSPASNVNPLSPRSSTPTDSGLHSRAPLRTQNPQHSKEGIPVRSPIAAGVQQAPDMGIGGSAAGGMQRGGSLNVPPPVGRTAGGLKGNWAAFWEAVMRDHCHAGLIWNEGTRAELREALQVLPALLPPYDLLALCSLWLVHHLCGDSHYSYTAQSLNCCSAVKCIWRFTCNV